jgi:hypothetical protein
VTGKLEEIQMFQNKKILLAFGGVLLAATGAAILVPGEWGWSSAIIGTAEPVSLLLIGSVLTVGGLLGRAGR